MLFRLAFTLHKLMNKLHILLKYVRESMVEFHTTGSIMPTTKWAAKAMTTPLREEHSSEGRKILELGPGTGSVTIKILSDMNGSDELSICEINPRFMEALKEVLRHNPDFQKHKERVRFFCCPAQELPEDRKYDVVVCALPFLNFDLHTVRGIFAKLTALSYENTVMTNFEYIGIRGISKALSPRRRRRRMYQVDRFFKKIAPPAQVREEVWFNVPPIHVYTRRLAA